MKDENWLAIALVTINSIAVLLAPTLSVWAKSRINQPKPTQSKGGWLIRLSQSPWLGWGPLAGIPLNVWVVSRELAKTTPITRASILDISISLSSIVLIWGTAGTTLLNQVVRKNANQTAEWVLNLLEILNRQTATLGAIEKSDTQLNTRLEALEKPTVPNGNSAEPKSGLMRRLLKAIRNVEE